MDIYGSVQPILLDLDYLATVTLYTFTVHTFNTSQHTSSKLFEYDSPQNDQFWAVITILLGLQLRKCSAPPCCVFQTNWIQPHTFSLVKAASDCADYDEYIQLCYLRLPKDLHRHHDHVHMRQWHKENLHVPTFEQWQAFSTYPCLALGGRAASFVPTMARACGAVAPAALPTNPHSTRPH